MRRQDETLQRDKTLQGLFSLLKLVMGDTSFTEGVFLCLFLTLYGERREKRGHEST